jgi:uncharacterized RDD family membrane protein YckC
LHIVPDVNTGGTTVVFCNACGAHNAPDARFCQSCGQAMAAIEPLPVTASIAAYADATYGGFWIRVVAAIIDTIVVEIVVLPISFAMGLGLGVAGSAVRMPGQGVQFVGVVTGMALGVLAVWLYEALMTSSGKQATVGKMALGLRVTDLEGNRIGFGRATARVFAKYLSAMILGIGFLMVAFTGKKQGLHDILAGTLVQKTR